jgi:hypothetical protein
MRTTFRALWGAPKRTLIVCPSQGLVLFGGGASADTTPDNKCCRLVLWGPASAWKGPRDIQRGGALEVRGVGIDVCSRRKYRPTRGRGSISSSSVGTLARTHYGKARSSGTAPDPALGVYPALALLVVAGTIANAAPGGVHGKPTPSPSVNASATSEPTETESPEPTETESPDAKPADKTGKVPDFSGCVGLTGGWTTRSAGTGRC